MIRFITTLLASFSLFIYSVPALAAAPAAPAPLNGQWKGPLKLLGGEITIIITIVPLTNGTYYAALDAPQQRISRMPVEVELKDDRPHADTSSRPAAASWARCWTMAPPSAAPGSSPA